MHSISVLLLALMHIGTGGFSEQNFSNFATDESSSGSWSYDDIPAWGNINPICNTGKRQSPINLTNSALFNPTTAPLLFSNYDVPLSGRLIIHNNGHSVEMDIPATENGQSPSIAGGILKSSYEAISLHFHWGAPGIRGSEHSINRRRYDVEMHIVHRHVNYTMEEALEREDGLAVLGVMLQITNNPTRFAPGLNRIFNRLPAVVEYDSSAALNGRITLGQVLGDLNTKTFFTYKGSLTTPPCSETVTFIVFPDAFPVTYAQVSQFFDILDENNNNLLENYRPIQNRNGRTIYYRSGRPIFFPPFTQPVIPPFSQPVLPPFYPIFTN